MDNTQRLTKGATAGTLEPNRMLNLRGIVIAICMMVFAAACTVQPASVVPIEADSSPPPPIPTLTPSLTPPPALKPSATPLPTETPRPTHTHTPAPTATPSKVPTRTPTAAPSRTPRPTSSPQPTATPFVDRNCITPFFGDYNRYWLSAEKWPTPITDPTDHLWFGKPLEPGSGRFLINENYTYGYDGGRNLDLLLHIGVDAGAALAAPILAIGDGTVVFARSDVNELHGWRCNWYGNFVTILHDQKWLGQPVYSLYGHVQDFFVEEGDRVEQGQEIATVGAGGAAISWHLHLEIRVGEAGFDDSRNPLLWLKPGVGRGILAGRLVDPDGRPWQGVAIRVLRKGDDVEDARTTWSYLGDANNLAQPDEHLAENFVLADLLPGEYELYTEVQDVAYSYRVRVLPNVVNQVEIQTLPLKSQSPLPTEPPEPEDME